MQSMKAWLKPNYYVWNLRNLWFWNAVRRAIERDAPIPTLLSAKKMFRMAVREARWFERASPEVRLRYTRATGASLAEMLEWIKLLHANMKAAATMTAQRRRDLHDGDFALRHPRPEKQPFKGQRRRFAQRLPLPNKEV